MPVQLQETLQTNLWAVVVILLGLFVAAHVQMNAVI